MHKLISRVVLAIGMVSSLSLLSAATPGIGVAMTGDTIVLNHARTGGNATIFNGSTLETERAQSVVLLKNGSQVRFATESRGKLYSDHLELQKGSARISDYPANAGGLTVRTDGKGTATVSMQGSLVEVAAITGNVHVFNGSGINVANLAPGRALNLRPQEAGASAPSSLTGCAVRTGNTTTLTDETSNVTVELRGGNVRPGRRIQVTGSMVPNATPSSPATQVVSVTNVREVGGSCRAGAAAQTVGGAGAATAGAAAGAAGAAAGVSATTAVVAGVAATAAVGTGIGVAVTQGSSSPSQAAGSGAINPSSGGPITPPMF